MPVRDQKTARTVPSPGQRAVSVNDVGTWQPLAMWSAVIFCIALSVTAIGWTYWHGHFPWGIGGVAQRRAGGTQDQAASGKPAAPVEKRRALDGKPVAADYAEPELFAVMIDNMVEARPTSGVAAAPLVIEAPVEGGITRFEAFYPADETVGRIGPIRSARPYYLDWASEFDALYAHVGGSPEALDKLKGMDLRDLNQFYRGKYFWRDTGRAAPHNVYSSTELLSGAAEAVFKRTHEAPAAWQFQEEAALADRPESAPDLSVDFSTPAYLAVWRYDRTTNDYRRLQNDAYARDEDGVAIRAKNVVVQYVKVRILDEIGRRRIDTAGEGSALVARDGRVIEATWRKAERGGRTRYFDQAGKEIGFIPGTTWIEMTPNGAAVQH